MQSTSNNDEIQVKSAEEPLPKPLGGGEGTETKSKAEDPQTETAKKPQEPSGKTVNTDAIVKQIIASGKLTLEEAKAIKDLLNDQSALKTKIDRLKGLLGRSAKAQREAAVELKGCQKKLDQAQRDIKRLTEKVDHLSTRPTHSEYRLIFQVDTCQFFSHLTLFVLFPPTFLPLKWIYSMTSKPTSIKPC